MRTILLALFCCTTLSAFADKVVIANCKEGSGCKFELTEFESDLFEKDFGREIEPNDIAVSGKKKNGEIIQYLDKQTRAQIDREWGGDGFTQIGLFNPFLQPLDGTWKVLYGNSTGNTCYGIGDIGAFVRGKIQPGKQGNGEINFNKPFHPSKLFPSSQMRWIKTGFATYRGILDFGHGMTSPMKMLYDITIINEKKIESFYTIEVKVPTKEACIAKIPVTFTLIRAKKSDDKTPFDDIPEPSAQDDDLLPVNPTGKGKSDDLLDVKSKDELIPIESKTKKSQTNVPRVDEQPETDVPRIEDKPKTNVPRVN